MLSLVSVSNRVLMILWIVFVGWTVAKKVEQRFPAQLSGALVVVIGSVMGYFVAAIDNVAAATNIGLKLLGFLILPLMLTYSAIFQIDARAKTVVLLFNLFASVIFIDLYFSDKRHIFDGPYGPVELDVVTLGYANANQTAMYLFLCVVSLVAGVTYFKKSLVKILFAADATLIAWFLQQTGSRTAMLLLATFLVLIWFTGKKEMSNAWITTALLIPALYVVIVPVASNLTVMGESLMNGRDEIFNRYFSRLTVGSFLLGDMGRFRFDNMHNGYVAIAASVGVPACVGYIHLLSTCLKLNRPRYGAPTFDRVAFVGFLCAVMYTGAEAAFFVGGSTYAMLIFSVFILFAKSRLVSVKREGIV